MEHHGVLLENGTDLDVNILDYGLDSLGYIMLLVDIEKTFDVELNNSSLMNPQRITMNDLIRFVQECKTKK